MPRIFFRFPAKEHQQQEPLTPSPPILPPKPAVARPGPQPSSQTASIRSRRITSPISVAHPSPDQATAGQQRGPTRLPHRVSVSDSYAQGTAWRASSTAPPSESAPPQLAPRSAGVSSSASPAYQPAKKSSKGAQSPLRPLRRSKGHQPIANERERRESEKAKDAASVAAAAVSAALQEETAQLKNEINQDTIRLTRIRQRQQAIREERERVALEQEKRARSQSREPPIIPTTTSNASVNNTSNMYNAPHNINHANPYGKCQSTPVLPQSQPEWIPYGHYHAPRGGARSTAQSRESFQSASSQDNNTDFRRVRTPSASSNDRSPPPYHYHGAHASYSPPNASQQQHWQKMEQARKERERERAMARLKETRELERKAFVDAWAVYESRWMLLTYATRSTTVGGAPSAKALTLSFFDIPWPLLHPPRGCEDITTAAIRRFIASEHQQEKDKTHRERIKEALLRWHPDRWTRILDHVRTDHREEVRKGVDIVVRCLNELLHRQ